MRRSTTIRRISALVLLLTLAACAEKSQPFEGDQGLPPPRTATTAPGEPGQPAAGETQSPETTAGGSARRPSGGGDGASATSAPPRGGDTSDDGIAAAARGGVGAFGPTVLRPDRSQRIVLDVIAEPGAGPASASLDDAVAVLRSASAKPVSVTSTVVDARRASWSASDLRSFADERARTAQGNGTAALRVLFVRGGLAGNESAVGVAVRGDVLAIFADRVDEASSPLVPRARMENAVLVHEIGHVLGLVDLVIDTGRDDPERPGHSRNSRSVMYWAVESTLVGQALNGPPPTQFDSEDLADLSRIRNSG